jgi:hypothetical protein
LPDRRAGGRAVNLLGTAIPETPPRRKPSPRSSAARSDWRSPQMNCPASRTTTARARCRATLLARRQHHGAARPARNVAAVRRPGLRGLREMLSPEATTNLRGASGDPRCAPRPGVGHGPGERATQGGAGRRSAAAGPAPDAASTRFTASWPSCSLSEPGARSTQISRPRRPVRPSPGAVGASGGHRRTPRRSRVPTAPTAPARRPGEARSRPCARLCWPAPTRRTHPCVPAPERLPHCRPCCARQGHGDGLADVDIRSGRPTRRRGASCAG